MTETFKNFPPTSLPLIEKLLAIDPAERGSATAALNSEVSILINHTLLIKEKCSICLMAP